VIKYQNDSGFLSFVCERWGMLKEKVTWNGALTREQKVV